MVKKMFPFLLKLENGQKDIWNGRGPWPITLGLSIALVDTIKKASLQLYHMQSAKTSKELKGQ
jgi:hypothetical protein